MLLMLILVAAFNAVWVDMHTYSLKCKAHNRDSVLHSCTQKGMNDAER